MKLIGYTCVFNESKMIPYVMPYVERLQYDKFIVYDNGSTDDTVEQLSKYPFVEIRHYDTDGKFNNTAKRNIEIGAYSECRRMSANELVWMSFTDFDEVIYCSEDMPFRKWIEGAYNLDGYNCFDGRMNALTCPDPKRQIGRKALPHMYDGVRMTWQVMGWCKPLLIAVNDFPYMEFCLGNHCAFAQLAKEKEIHSMANCGLLHAFHLKYFDKDVVEEKHKWYVERGNKKYDEHFADFDDIYYNSIVGSSFPMDMYFALSGLMIRDDSANGMWERLRPMSEKEIMCKRFYR